MSIGGALCACGLLAIVPLQITGQNQGTSAIVKRLRPDATQGRKLTALNQARSFQSFLRRPEELAPFFERLHRMSSVSDAEPVHILHFGDSHTSSDQWTAPLRALFQRRFGEGGSGFSIAGRPFRGYTRLDAFGGSSSGWKVVSGRSGKTDGYFGLGGVSITTERAGESVYLNADCDLLEIHYLQQPNGGTLALYEDGKLREEFSTAGERNPGIRVIATRPGAHRFVLTTTSARPVRLFGWVADRPEGVTYEALGLIGARASVMLAWDEEMLETYLNARDPSLIILAYGTNEAVDSHLGAQRYQQTFSALLARLRSMARDTPILVIGPPDIHPPAEVDRVIVAQEKAAEENGCAFWDMRERMGGPGSMLEWARAGLAGKDYVHFNSKGYRHLAEALFSDLMQSYDTYERVRLQIMRQDGDE
jgi:lysophospholipase L1-like esterase